MKAKTTKKLKRKLRIRIQVVALVSLVGVLSFFSGVYVTTKTPVPAQILDGINVDMRPKPLSAPLVESLINQERAKVGLTPLAHSDLLQKSACMKLDDMVAKNYWSHVSPTKETAWYWINRVGYVYIHAGENLAYGQRSEPDLVRGWMDSPSHKRNIVGDFVESSICTKSVRFQNGYYNLTVQHFGSPR